MFYAYVDPEGRCLVCGDETDRDDIVEHHMLGPCCYRCACAEDFPPDVDLDLSESV